MELNDECRLVVAHLLAAPDAYVYGKRRGTTPFELRDRAAEAQPFSATKAPSQEIL